VIAESAEPRADVVAELLTAHRSARQRTLDLVSGLDDAQLMGPRLAIVNPMRWEIGHVAWFQEFWALRHARGEAPIRSDGDPLYDSSRVAHDTRWTLPLPSMRETLAYAEEVLERVVDRLASRLPTDEQAYFHRLAVFHEDMHDEAFTYTRQTHAYPAPRFEGAARDGVRAGAFSGDVAVGGGEFLLGAVRDEPFVFDNEKWAHPVFAAPFRIARAPVTNREFSAFVEAGGYRERALWSDEGWRWKETVSAAAPVYWRRSEAGTWERRDFDAWVPLELDHPIIHVCWHEANAYCRWAGRRLPTEAEWEMAAACELGSPDAKRRYPWGDRPSTPRLANLDGLALGVIDVGALPAGESAFGCRQMLGNVWEWTSSELQPYPGFIVDPYAEYSAPWFGTHRVLRGGSWATPARLMRNTWRNFYTPDRRDIFAGFRTCAIGG
jgi:iron(II)-dependent oxidoreductase